MNEKKYTILIVDDDPVNREILKAIFADEYEIDTAENGVEAVGKIWHDRKRYSAVLLDIVMPKMDGIEVLRRLHDEKILTSLPVFLITAESDMTCIKEAYNLGVMDVIHKPVVPYVVRRRIESVIELFESRKRLNIQVDIQQEELYENALLIKELNQGMIEAMATAIEFRDVESGNHVQRIREITKCILTRTEFGEGLTKEEIDDISLAAVLHDIGKIAIPDAILNKPGRLTPEEFEIMKTHALKGALLLENIPALRQNSIYRYAYDIARHHHERWDGCGYPDKLKGDEISRWAQVVSIADVYDALSCDRVYKKAYPRKQVIEMITDGQCGTFNPRLLDAFLTVEDKIYPMYQAGGVDDPFSGLDSLLPIRKKGAKPA